MISNEVADRIRKGEEVTLVVPSTELTVEKPQAEQFTITVTVERVETLRQKAFAVTLQGVERQEDGSIIIHDPDAMLADRDGLKLVKATRMEARSTRTTCEKEHAAIKEDALRECQKIDKSRRDLTKAIELIEQPLLSLENAVEAELDRRAKEQADKKYAARCQILRDVDSELTEFNEHLIRSMDEDAFARFVVTVSAEKKRRWEAEQEAARVAEVNRLESERLAEERRLFAIQQEELNRLRKLEQDRLDAELAIKRQELADQEARMKALKDESDRLARIEADRVEANRLAEENKQAAERARIAQEAAKLEETARVQREEADRLEAARIAHENEVAEREAAIIRERDRIDREEMLAPYMAVDAAKHWYVRAAEKIVDHLGCDVDDRAEVEAIAAIIFDEYKTDCQKYNSSTNM